MPTFSDDKVTFIHIPKNAGTSITTWYANNILLHKQKTITTPEFKKILSIQNIPNYKLHMFLSEIEKPAPITFAVIRNPWDKVVSSYFMMKIFIKDLSFEQFVKVNIKIDFFDEHELSTPQVRWIEPGVTHLLRFENLKEEFKVIQDIFQCYEPLRYDINKLYHNHYRTYYNDETKQIVAEMFKEDIEAFGYEF